MHVLRLLRIFIPLLLVAAIVAARVARARRRAPICSARATQVERRLGTAAPGLDARYRRARRGRTTAVTPVPGPLHQIVDAGRRRVRAAGSDLERHGGSVTSEVDAANTLESLGRRLVLAAQRRAPLERQPGGARRTVDAFAALDAARPARRRSTTRSRRFERERDRPGSQRRRPLLGYGVDPAPTTRPTGASTADSAPDRAALAGHDAEPGPASSCLHPVVMVARMTLVIGIIVGCAFGAAVAARGACSARRPASAPAGRAPAADPIAPARRAGRPPRRRAAPRPRRDAQPPARDEPRAPRAGAGASGSELDGKKSLIDQQLVTMTGELDKVDRARAPARRRAAQGLRRAEQRAPRASTRASPRCPSTRSSSARCWRARRRAASGASAWPKTCCGSPGCSRASTTASRRTLESAGPTRLHVPDAQRSRACTWT